MGSIPLPALDVRPPQQQESPLQSYAQLLQLQNMQRNAPLQTQALQQQVQTSGLENQQRQQDLQARQALNAAYAGSVSKDAQGNMSFDPDKLQQSLMTGPAAYQTPEVMKNLTAFQKTKVDLQTSVVDLQQKQADMAGSAAAAIKAANYDPTLAHSLLDTLPQSPQLQQFRAAIDNPAQLKQWTDTIIANSPKQQELTNQRTVAGIRSNTAPMQEMNSWLAANPGKTPTDYQQHTADQQVQTHVAEETNPDVVAAKINVAQHTPTAMIMGNQLGGDQNSQALDFAADNYRKTGQMPAGLMRSPGSTVAIIQRAAQLDQQEGGSGIATNKTILASNQASLKKLQTNYDQVQAFEQTAIKNMNLLQQTAQKIPDLGTRFANIPARMISSTMIGTDNMAAFKTALYTAQTEAAKVLNSSNATGVLSDSSRHELQDIIDGNMPVSAMVKSLDTLRQDMNNRTQSYQAQIGDIQNRVRGAGQGNQPAQGNTPQNGNQPQTNFFQQFGGAPHQ